MKTLEWLGWVSLSAGCLIVLFATVSLISGRSLFGFTHVVNYFHAANSFFLIAVALFIAVYRCKGSREA